MVSDTSLPVASKATIRRMTEVEGFQAMVSEFKGRCSIALGAAEFGPEFRTIEEFTNAAKGNVVWNSAEPSDEEEAAAIDG